MFEHKSGALADRQQRQEHLLPEERERIVHKWLALRENGRHYEDEFHLRRHDGVFQWFRTIADSTQDDSGRNVRWFGALVNIDGQKRAEEVLNETQARLSRSAQFATVAEFAASIAHEVAQPLFGANMNVEACLSWLSANPPNIERARESALIAIEDGQDASRVIQKVRDLFRKSEPSKEQVDIHQAVAEVVRLMRDELARKRTTINIILHESIPSVWVDRLQIQQVMWNLIHNAVDAMEHLPSDRVVELSIRSVKDDVSISVADRGVGFPDPDHAFDAFFTTKPNGMGMGLTICKSIIEAHGGRLHLASNSGPGTTVSFVIPAQRSETA
jgi:signal transduction histidine kinase